MGGFPDGTLGRLLEVEQRVAARLDDARTRARELIAAARTESEASHHESTRQLSTARAQLARDMESEEAAALRNIEAKAATQIERYAALDESRVFALADSLLRQLLSGDAP